MCASASCSYQHGALGRTINNYVDGASKLCKALVKAQLAVEAVATVVETLPLIGLATDQPYYLIKQRLLNAHSRRRTQKLEETLTITVTYRILSKIIF